MSPTPVLQLIDQLPVVTDVPENHGAKRDGKLITGATYTSATKIVTAASAIFTSADVGKVMVMRQPTSAGAHPTYVSTIATFTDATHVVLTADPVGSNLVSTFMCYGTDDTAAINAAITAVVAAGQANGTNAGLVLLSAGIYMIAAATTKTTTNLGNAQIPLPAIRPDLADKFELEIRGVGDGSSPIHWYALTPQMSGTILFSTLQGGTNDTTWGYPSVIGSTTAVAQNNNGFSSGYGGSGNQWSNCHLTISSLRLIVPNTPTLTGMDLRGLGTASLDKIGVFPFNNPTDMNSNLPANGNVGVYMPSLNNNDLSEIGSFTIYNYAYGLGVSDHLNWKSARFIYCNSAILIAGPNGSNIYVHGIKGGYTSIEGCNVGIDASVFTPPTPGIPRFPVIIDEINFEINTSYHVNDPNSFLTGTIWMTDANSAPAALNINGGKNLNIINGFQSLGIRNLVTTSASSPITTSTYTFVVVDGGCVIEGNSASAQTFTVPPNSSVAFPVGTVLEVFQLGGGQITLAPGAGVTFRSDGGKVNTAAQYATVGLRQRAANEWVLSGDLA